MLGVIFYFSIGVISTELYEKRFSSRKKEKSNLKTVVLATLGGFFWIVVLAVDFLQNQIFSELSHKNLSDLTKKRAQATFSLRQAKG